MKKILCLMGGAMHMNLLKIIHSAVANRDNQHRFGSYILQVRQWTIYCTLLIAFCNPINAQTKNTLELGGKMPDVSINFTLGGSIKEKSLTEIDKPIIFDFFATTCSGCIALLPHLDSLQKKFGESIKIMVVTKESRTHISNFLKKNPIAKNIDLTFIVEDTTINKLFRYRTIPHEVWIGKDLIVKAITGDGYLTPSYIRSFIDNRKINLPLKDDYVKFDINKGLEHYALQKRLFGKSYFSGYIDNAPYFYSGNIYGKDSIFKEDFYVNFPPIPFILAVLGESFRENRILIEVQDSSKLIKPKNADLSWTIDHCYSYTLTATTQTPDSLRRSKILFDLGQQMSLQIRKEKQLTACYELVATGGQKVNIDSKGGNPGSNFYPTNGQPVTMKNQPLSLLVKVLNNGHWKDHPPIIVNGLTDRNVDLTLPIKNISDISAVDKALRAYGLQLHKTAKLLDMIVITDL